MSVNIDDNRIALAIPPFLRLAFRPFFLGGAVFSMVAIGWWVWYWTFPGSWLPYGGPVWWHAHEMVFGFSCLIVVGFLLTAVKNWTGTTGLRGAPLFMLFALWVLGRCALALSFLLGDSLSPYWIAFVDVLFLPAAAAAMFYPVYMVRQWRNMFFVPLLLLFTLLNGASHWAVLNDRPDLAVRALHSAIFLVCLVIAIMGGRVIPMFTANGTGTKKVMPIKWLDQLSLLSLNLIVASSIAGFENLPNSWISSLFAIAAAANAYRFIRWGFWKCGKVPLLWSLHIGYAFLPIGLIVTLLHFNDIAVISYSTAIHFFSVGAIGGMILAMISRVSLGHVGLPLTPPKTMSVAFILVLLAAIFRTIIPILAPSLIQWSIVSAGVLWMIAYGLFCLCYGPMLWSTRVDGRPG
mgnify:CR=1 FL=1